VGRQRSSLRETKTTDGSPDTPDFPPRAKRFVILLPFRYRKAGETQWHEGTILNMSGTGVLFQGDELLELKTEVEIRLVMPAPAKKERPAEIVCYGNVVRAIPVAGSDSASFIAVSLRRYQFVRRPR